MEQLDGHDAAFLYSDTTHSNSNISLIHIYDQSTAAGGKVRFKTILAHIESRLHRSPVFRRKLLRVPLEMDYPYWVEDENFDLEYHVRHIALPKPGDWRQFCIQASRIHARPLDQSRPLWEIYVIEGLDSLLELPVGSFALLTKVHHAAISIGQGSEITMLLHDIMQAPAAPEPPEPWFPASPPGNVSMACRSVVNTVTSSLKLAGPLTRAIRRVTPAAFSLASEILLRPENLPVTRFNSVVSPYRIFETRRFTLDEFKTIRSAVDGATVNDAVLAVCGGALRRFLQAQGELPEASLTAIAPISIRDADTPAGGKSEVSWLHVPLGTEMADPIERLRMIQEHTRSSDTIARAVGARELTDIGRHAPAATLALTSKMLGRVAQGIGRRAPLANCTITNVPGPSVPLYLCGARMTYFSAIMPITDGMGLVFAVTSYDGRILISPTSCRELVPDPEAFAQCIRDSFQETLAAAQAQRPRKTAVRAGAAVKRARARTPPAVRRTPARRSSAGKDARPRPSA